MSLLTSLEELHLSGNIQRSCLDFRVSRSGKDTLGGRTGNKGGGSEAEGGEYEYDNMLCFPTRSVESAVSPYAEGNFRLLDEKYNGRTFDASPTFDDVDGDDDK
jgi:hypothetical protein